MLATIFGFSTFLESSLYIWKFLVHILLKPRLKDFEPYQNSSMWNDCSYTVVWTFFSIVLPWDWNENWPFPVLWPLLSFPNLLAYWVQHEIKRSLLLGRKVVTNLDSTLKSRDITLPNKGPSSQSYGFSNSCVWMWQLDYKESWVPKNWCFWTVVLEKTLESPLYWKEIEPVDPKGNQSWIFFGRTDAEAEAPILCPPDAKNWPTGKDPDAGRDCGQEEKGTTEHEMVGWHHRLNGHEFE